VEDDRAQQCDLQRVLDEQAALRRVATLVARHAPSDVVFLAVAEEVCLLLGVTDTRMVRYEDDGTATIVADHGPRDPATEIGGRVALGGRNVTTLVHDTGKAARIEDYSEASGPVGEYARNVGNRSAIGTPIVVDGRLWGAMISADRSGGRVPGDAEERVQQFTELIATAIYNLETRAELAASRARMLAAADEERRRVVRDLHDGAQQRLVHTLVSLKVARQQLGEERGSALDEAIEHCKLALRELRDLAHGILPAALSTQGLRGGLMALVARAPMVVALDVAVGRLSPAVEATAYFVVAEALTNVFKHAEAEHVTVTARVADGALQVAVRDDGRGGAEPRRGLVGLQDRLAAVGGHLEITSGAAGTEVAATIPLG
jgi:signal transduction histidine kinase